MGNLTKFIMGLSPLLLISSCTKDFEETAFEPDVQNLNAVATVDSPETIARLVGGDDEPLTRSSAIAQGVQFENSFVSMMDTYKVVDRVPVTYYEFFEYEKLVPNTSLAALLNTKGEIQVGEMMYRVTESGTYYYDPALQDKVDAMIDELDRSAGKSIGEWTVELAPGIIRYNTFEEAAETVAVDDEVFYANDPNWNNDAYYDAIDQRLGSAVEALSLSPSLSNIPTINFPRYNAAAKTIVGKWLEEWIGRNKAYHVKFSKNRRLKGKLYYYKYLFYDEFGLLGEVQKKNWIGWSGKKASEITIGWSGVLVELKLPMPLPPQSQLPINPYSPDYIGSYTGSIPGSGAKGKVIVIAGIDVNSSAFKSILKSGTKAIINWLKSKTNGESDVDNARAALIVGTDRKVYSLIIDDAITKRNVEKVRKVFSSDFHFFISVPTKAPGSWQAWLKGISSGSGKLPTKSLSSAECVVAAKLDDKWKGMILYKN